LRVEGSGFRVEGVGSGAAPAIHISALAHFRVTSLIRKRTPLGPYRRPMPRVLGWS